MTVNKQAGDLNPSIDLSVYRRRLSAALCKMLEENGFIACSDVIECARKLERETKVDLRCLYQSAGHFN